MQKQKSLRRKLISVYLGIIVGTFLILAAILPTLIRSYFINNQENILKKQGQAVAQFYETTIVGGQKDLLVTDFLTSLISSVLETEIWFVDGETGQILSSKNIPLVMNMDAPIVKQILQGNTITTTVGFERFFENKVLTMGMPLQKNGEVELLMFLHTEIPLIESTVKDMQFIISFVLLISLMVAVILVLILSRDIITPINQMNAAAKKMAGGNFAAKVEIYSDDEVGELARSFNHMGEELGKLEELRKSFIANISHDFRSPLTSIKGFLQAILDGTIPEEKQEYYLNVVLDETERLTKMTNDILHLTKMESNQVQLTFQDFDVHETIRKILIGMEQQINAKNIQVELFFIEEKLSVLGDIEQIQRVIYNLLDNAIKFTEAGDKITIETTVISKKAYITITDTGPGISESSLKHIFDRFHKGDNSRGMHRKGTGLGLAIVKEIIKMHNQQISVTSKEGEGTSFSFSLALSNNTKLLTKRS